MSRYLPPLNALRAFEAAGRHQSFTGSADELNVSHAAISRHVRGLEKQLGVQLFKNVARGVVLTEAGHGYLKEITPALDRISQASEHLRCRADGNLSISCESTFAMKWLMPRLGSFRNQYPEIDVTLVSSNSYADIGNNEFDLAVRCCASVEQGLEFDTISNTPYFPYGSPQLPVPGSTGRLFETWPAQLGHWSNVDKMVCKSGSARAESSPFTPVHLIRCSPLKGQLLVRAMCLLHRNWWPSMSRAIACNRCLRSGWSLSVIFWSIPRSPADERRLWRFANGWLKKR